DNRQYSALIGAAYQFNERWMARAGYFRYHIDVSHGSGDNAFGSDMDFDAFWLGVAYGEW
ncbi:MAG: hypothetical protein ACYTF0_05950, partial [Planctomycetota bacterium]